MPKLRKQKRAQKFRYKINRKRLDKQERGMGHIKCPEIRKAWSNRMPIGKNLYEMGLASDPNKVLKIPNVKEERIKLIKLVNGFTEEDINQEDVNMKDEETIKPRLKKYVIEQLEADANEFRESGFRYSKGIVQHLSYLLDKYQLNYKAMARDDKNYEQETWKQLRAKIRKFMKIPQQFNKYMESRNLDINNLNWKECNSDDE